jgi:hypothetical protein
MHIIEQFPLSVLLHAILVLLPPEGEVHMPVAVMRVYAHILSQVGHPLLRVPDRSCNRYRKKMTQK